MSMFCAVYTDVAKSWRLFGKMLRRFVGDQAAVCGDNRTAAATASAAAAAAAGDAGGAG
jgi:hypothetical protein